MSLVLTVISYRRQPMAQPLSQRFESPNITVGRSPENDWTLPDPDQLISKKHCAIRLQGGRYSVTDTSTNGVFVNDSPSPLGNGQSMPLTDGDKLLLGQYEILVRLEGVSPAYAAPPGYAAAPPLAQAPLPVGSGDDPFGLDGFDFAQGSSPSPLAPIAAQPSGASGFPASGNPFAASPGEMQGFAAPPAGAPLIPPLQPPMPMPAPPPAMPPVVVEKMPGRGAAPSGAAAWPAAPPLPIEAGFRSAAALPEIGGFAMPGAIGPGPALPQPAAFAAPAATPRAQLPPEPAVAPAVAMRPAAPARPSAGAASTGGDAAALLAAFLAGAGIEPGALRDENPAELMAAVGQLFREMAAGLRDALATRAMIKSEYRVEQTVIRAANNNPLKFAVDVNQLLLALLSRGRPGYLTGAQAVQEGFKDLQTHEIALLGGMQAAVAALLRQFDPEPLKQRLEQQSLLQNILPAARKAKYWEIYEQHYKQIAADVSEDVRGTFGRAFANAYEEQAKKL